jgi:type IV pilus assembly protein PilC
MNEGIYKKVFSRIKFFVEQKQKIYFLRLSNQEKIIFAKRLSVLISAGVPILTALGMLKNQADSKSVIYIIGHLANNLENGASLSFGMGKFKQVFDEFAINIVRVGEASGRLPENLNYLARELKKQQDLSRKILSALVYPMFIVVATLGILILLTGYVFPKIIPIFQSFKLQLPWTTRVLIFLSNTWSGHWFAIIITFAAGIGLIGLLLKNLSVKLWVHGKMLRLPLLGGMLRSYYIANFTRTLGLLLKSEIKIVKALKMTAAASVNLAYREKFYLIADRLTRGEKLSRNMQRQAWMFPPMLWQMVEVGEATGSLSETLIYLSEIYEDELNNSAANLSVSIEPLLMIFMGLLVGFVAISIITPIYGITQNLHP